MDSRQRHTPRQIDQKLKEADDLAANGRTQREIAQVLGISVMTFHRWRKSHYLAAVSGARSMAAVAARSERSDLDTRVTELQTENIRLRRLVTDLLLEKMRLEEAAREKLAAEEMAPVREDRKFAQL